MSRNKKEAFYSQVRRLFIYLGLMLIGVGFVAAPSAWFQNRPKSAFAHSLIHQMLQGRLTGEHHGADLPVDMSRAEPGDIILCHNPRGAYGYWTHAVLYVGQGQAVDAYDFSRGTVLQDVNHYRHYDEVEIARPNLGRKLREKAAAFARRQVGTPYDPLSPLHDTHSAYCSKLIWEAYANVGVPLFKTKGWITPDEVAESPILIEVEHWRH